MRKLAVALVAVSIVAFAALSYGQMGGPGMGPGMMGGPGAGSGMMSGSGMGPGMMGGPGAGCGMMGGGGMGGRMMGGEHPMWKNLMALNLDEQQKTSIGEIKSRVMKDSIKRMADMRIAQIELKDLLSKDPVDMKTVEAKVKQSEMMRTEMHLSHIKAMEEVKAKLTPDQRKKFREMVEAGPMMRGMGMMHGQEDCCTTKE